MATGVDAGAAMVAAVAVAACGDGFGADYIEKNLNFKEVFFLLLFYWKYSKAVRFYLKIKKMLSLTKSFFLTMSKRVKYFCLFFK